MNKLAQYATDPMAFFGDLPIRTEAGQVPFATVQTPFQYEWLSAVAPALLAASAGTVPAIRKFWAEAVKGSAKTTMIAMAVLWAVAFSRRPLRIQIGAFDGDQAAEVRLAAHGILRALPWLAERVVSDKWQLSCKRTGSTCEILASDPHGTSGGNPDIVVLDEAVQITREEYAAHMLNNASKRHDSITIISTNAGFQGTWQFTLREMARTSPLWSFHQGLDRPPQITLEEFEEARQFNTATRFARYFLGVWGSGAGDALDPEAIQDAITLQGPMSRPLDGWSFVAGLDLGLTRDHAGLVMLGCEQGKNRIALCQLESWKPPKRGQVDLSDIERTIVMLHRRFHFRELWYDPWQCEMLAQNLRRSGIHAEPMHFNGGNLNMMASVLIETFASRQIDLWNDSQLIRDLQRLTITEKSYGYKLESTRDADGHADRATALTIALPAAARLAHYKARGHTAPSRHARFPTDPMHYGVQLVPSQRRH
jgi:phage terminase large subunit-like protein